MKRSQLTYAYNFKFWLIALIGLLGLWSCSPDAGKTFTDTGKTVNVVLVTTMGKIHLEVYPDKAPQTAANFLYYVDEGLFDHKPQNHETGFYRIVTADNDNQEMGMSLVQGGTLNLASYTANIDHESTEMTGLSNIRGSVALARNHPGSGNASAFFVNIADNHFLDFGGKRNPDGQGYAVFGRVTKGLTILEKIQKQKTYSKETAEELPADFPLSPEQTLFEPIFITKAYRK